MIVVSALGLATRTGASPVPGEQPLAMVDAAAGVLRSGRAYTSPTATATPRQGSVCVADFNKVADPTRVAPGGQVAVSLTARAVCLMSPLHLAIVADTSAGMAGQPLADLKRWLTVLINGLPLASAANLRVGVVSFDDTAHKECDLTHDAAALTACIDGLGTHNAPQPNVAAGIDTGLAMLVAGRAAAPPGRLLAEVMLVLARRNQLGCSPALEAAARAKGQKVLVMTACAGPECEEACLLQMAASPRYFHNQLPPAGFLAPIFKVLTPQARFTVTDVLPANMAFVPGSAQPAPSSGDPATGLTWVTGMQSRPAITVTFRLVVPRVPGEYPTNVRATGEMVDSEGGSQQFEFPVPVIEVVAGAATPTPSATSTEMPSPTPTAVSSSTPTPRPGHPVLLPIAYRESP